MKTIATALIFAAGLAGAQNVIYNFDRTANFSRYRTYKWVQIEGSAQPDELMAYQIRSAVDAQLRMKGLTKVESTADVDVAFQVAVNKERQLNTFSSGTMWGWSSGMATTTVSTISVGTLDVDFYDPSRKQLVWRGTATKTLNPSKDPIKNLARVEKGVAKLLKNFPPPQAE